MEHSYIRNRTLESCDPCTSNGLQPTRIILMRRPPQCPHCHVAPLEEKYVEDNITETEKPLYNEIAAKEAMSESLCIANSVENKNSDDEDWQSKINLIGWSNMQIRLFSNVAGILDKGQLGCLAIVGRPDEAIQRRLLVDKSADHMHKEFSSVNWDSNLTKWLHSLLMDSLPPIYMALYLDILQTLNTKLPTLMEKILLPPPLNMSPVLLEYIMKAKWEPQIVTKVQKLSHDAIIVAVPTLPTNDSEPSRLQKWYQKLAAITRIVQPALPMTSNDLYGQPLEQVAEQIVSFTRFTIQELRNENPQRQIILIGFNAGAALAYY